MSDGMDPKNYRTVESFKAAYYEKNGVGSWIDDMKLEIVYKKANNEELDPILKELLEKRDQNE